MGAEKLALVGPGQLGKQIYNAMGGERLVIGVDEADCRRFGENPELGYSWDLKDAAACGIVAMTVHPEVCRSVLDAICPVMQEGSVILNFSTKYQIPEEVRAAYPKLSLLEAKVLGSAVGMSHGLKPVIVLSSRDAALTERVVAAFPGLKMVEGDWTLVPKINSIGTAGAIRAGFELQEEMVGQGIPAELAKAALDCLVPGALISYAAGTLGKFGLEVLEQLQKEKGQK